MLMKKKKSKYSNLESNYIFVPLGFKTIGHWGANAANFFSELGRLLTLTTGEPRSTAGLRQRLSIAIQTASVASVRGTVPEGTAMNELCHLPFDG